MPMNILRQVPGFTLGVLIAVTGLPLHAADDAALVEELRGIVEKSRQERAADRWLQGALEDLLAKYDRPWQRQILYEDFRDGDYTRGPAWQVLRGSFQVVRGQGLYSSAQGYATGSGQGAPAQPASPSEALSGLIVGALLDRALGPSGDPSDSTSGNGADSPRATSGGPAEIRLRAGVSNAFAIDIGFRHPTGGEAAFEVVLLQSEAGAYGYRLRVQSGPRGFIELQRLRRGQGAIVESQPLARSLADGALHELGWRQGPDGTVKVTIDGGEIFSVRDRAFRDPYPWLHLVNDLGEVTFRSVRVDGV